MSNKKTIQKNLSMSQIDQLEKDLIAERESDDPSLGTGSGQPVLHLTDEEFLLCLNRPMPSSRPNRLRDHLQVCPECMQEFTRLQECMRAIEEEASLNRIQQRVLNRFENRARSTGLAAEEIATGLTRPGAKFRVSLRPFFQHQFAAAAHTADADRIEFPILEAGNSVPGLLGVLLKRNDEYYARIEASDDQVFESFRDRSVRLTIVDEHENIPVFERTMQIGLIVFIGTGLKGTHNLSAELL